MTTAFPPAHRVDMTAATEPSLPELASARVAKLTKLVLPPGHEPVLDVMASIWNDGLRAGFQLTGQARAIGLPASVPEDRYEDLRNAEVCSEYEEFPELDDPDFHNIAFSRVQKLSKATLPVGHPEVSGYTVEIWMDGVATGLRIVKQDEAVRQPSTVD